MNNPGNLLTIVYEWKKVILVVFLNAEFMFNSKITV